MLEPAFCEVCLAEPTPFGGRLYSAPATCKSSSVGKLATAEPGVKKPIMGFPCGKLSLWAQSAGNLKIDWGVLRDYTWYVLEFKTEDIIQLTTDQGSSKLDRELEFTSAIKRELDRISINERSQLGYYLAGLIEGDGSIMVPSQIRRDSGILAYPIIKLAFNIKDKELADKIMEVLGGGTPEAPAETQSYNVLIQDVPTLYKVALLINGKMRTPKIEAHHRLIDWFNLRLKGKEAITKLGLDISSLGDNAWLSGFIESDGNFNFDMTIDSRGFGTDIHYYLRISQRREYHREVDHLDSSFSYSTSYLPIMQAIQAYFHVANIRNIKRQHKNYIELGYEIRALRVESRQLVIDYLTKFPLFSSKYQDYLAWLELHTMYKAKKHLSVNGAQEMLNIQKSMNSSRTRFNWDSLNNFYTS